MKKYIYLAVLLFLGLLIASCDNNTTEPASGPTTGSITVESEPTGADIFLDNSSSSTGQVTNATLSDVDFGNHSITLKLDGYRDTTVSTSISSDVSSAKVHVILTSTESITTYGPIRIWETAGTSASQPSGLDLSSGNAYGVSSTDNGKVDIYYSTTGTGGQGYLIQSANLNTAQGLTKETNFLVGSSTNLNDGLSSPFYPIGGTWTNHISDTESNYVFLYDDDSHYSKLRITNSGGGTGPTDPAWVEVTWIYNNIATDTRF